MKVRNEIILATGDKLGFCRYNKFATGMSVRVIRRIKNSNNSMMSRLGI
ncbi:MAG TPA: hypothetical protein VE130_10265 [Nitrososphaeraceae archaeon]|nr:hypothetical protein [Nitrososphaeraceae archaeon]